MASRSDRWDRDRFERARRYPDERDYHRFEDREGPRRSDIILDERIDRRGPRGRVEERERYFEEERYNPPPRRSTVFDQRPPPEVTGQALAPYRRPRPQFIRRQSSLDTFDKRPMARYGDEYRLPPDVPIPLPIRKPRSPPKERYVEEYEDLRYRGSEEDYRDFRVREQRRGNHRSKSRMRSRSVLRRRHSSSSSSESSFEEVEKDTEIGRKGRTKMPKRLVHKKAVIEKGLPFEEEDEFIIVLRALDKTHIDEIIEISKKYREEQLITYKYEGVVSPGEDREEVKEIEKEVKREEIKREEIKPDGTKTTERIEKIEKKEEVVEEAEHHHHHHHDHHDHHEPIVTGGELVKRTTTTTIIDPPDHHHHHQDLAVVVPNHHHRNSDAAIRREIRALEAERKALQMERAADWRLAKAERIRDGEWDLVEREQEIRDRRPRNVIRVEKDRKGRMALVRSAH